MHQNQHLVALLRQLQKIPYLASKNLDMVLYYFLQADTAEVERLCSALRAIKEHLDKCLICFAWKETGVACSFCSAPKRDKQVICVVHTWRDVMALERAGGYTGVYHILGGALSPLDGVGPDQLTFSALFERVASNDCSELIIGCNQTPEGEATASYAVTHLPRREQLRITRLARGLPVGASLAAMDRLTVSKALSERRPF